MAKQDPSISERETVEKLLATLQELPDVHTRPPKWEVAIPNSRARIDAEIDIKMAGRNFYLLVEVKKSLFPRDVRQALWQLKDCVRAFGHGKEVVPLLAAESIAPGSKELLRHENIGYYDTGGSLFIPAHGAYVYIDKPPPRALSKSVRVLFKGKRAQVLHVLLHDRHEWFSVKKLAEIAKVSPATVSETLTALERFNWLSTRGQGPAKERQVTDPRALLDEWKKQVLAGPKLSIRRYYVPSVSDSDKLVGRLDKVFESHDLEYVLTQEVAAQRYSPFLSAISRVACRVALGRRAHEAIEQLDAREVTEGANLTMIETLSQGAFLFKERLGSAWIANPIQVYLDLLLAAGRAQDIAEHLRHERIGF